MSSRTSSPRSPHALANKSSCIVLPRQTLLSVAVRERQEQFSCSQDLGASPCICHRGKEQWGRATFPCPCHHMENEGQVFISSALILRDSSPAIVSKGQLYCTAKQNIRLAPLSSAAGEGRDHFSLVLEPVMGGAKSVHPSPLSLQ